MHKILSKPNILFARVSPPHKLYIIETLKNLGYVVAFVGDGVNDSPGIKVANTGIAMISGSETCRDAADIILGNDDLENLLLGI
jgi:P-type E1-E2 ATPase